MVKHKDGSVSYEPYEKLSYIEWFKDFFSLLVMLPKILYVLYKKS